MENKSHFINILRDMLKDAWAENEALRQAFKAHIDTIQDPGTRSRARNEWPGLFRDRLLEIDLPKYLRKIEDKLGKQARIQFELFLPWNIKDVK